MTDVTRWEPDDRLSAYLDEEMNDAERTELAGELRQSARMRAELYVAADARRLVRTLPMVEPLASVLEIESERRRTAPKAAVGILAIAAAWLLILGFGAGTAALDVVPPVDDLLTRHAAAAELGDTSDRSEVEAFLPASLPGDMNMTTVVKDGSITQTVYTDGDHSISLFHQRGSVNWSGLPDDGQMMSMPEGDSAWQTERSTGSVMVLQRGASVVTVVADPDMDMMDDISPMVQVDDDGSSVLDRARGGVRRFLDLVTPGF